MLAFAGVFPWLVDSIVSAAFTGASLAGPIVAMKAWILRSRARAARRAGSHDKSSASATARSR
jgi:hypothetical protein